MSTRRWLIMAGLLVFVVIVGVHAVIPWEWSGQTSAPVPETVSFQCGALLGADYVHGPTTTAYPVVGTPCSGRRFRQTTTGLDLLLGTLGIVAVAAAGPLSRRSPG